MLVLLKGDTSALELGLSISLMLHYVSGSPRYTFSHGRGFYSSFKYFHCVLSFLHFPLLFPVPYRRVLYSYSRIPIEGVGV
jgi:hypothetical protein